MTIQQAYHSFCQQIQAVYDAGEAHSIARIVFEDCFRSYDFQSQQPLASENQERLMRIQNRLLQNEPIQYILGQADFFGLKLAVNSSVLIPRQETEELVDWVLQDYRHQQELRVLDIGTGSGCIPLAIKKSRADFELWAMDVSKAALQVAGENAATHQLDIHFLEASILNKTTWSEWGTFDLILSNPPYIPKAEKTEMPQRVLDHEPPLALFVENDNPLLFYEVIADFAALHLEANGALYFELNEFNAVQVEAMLSSKQYKFVELRKDLNGKDRMIKAMK